MVENDCPISFFNNDLNLLAKIMANRLSYFTNIYFHRDQVVHSRKARLEGLWILFLFYTPSEMGAGLGRPFALYWLAKGLWVGVLSLFVCYLRGLRGSVQCFQMFSAPCISTPQPRLNYKAIYANTSLLLGELKGLHIVPAHMWLWDRNASQSTQRQCWH